VSKVKAAKDVVMRWKGDGSAYIPGAPMRDIQPDEWNELTEDVRLAAQASGLYTADAVEATPAPATEG
jgi:hypothetical protein